MEERRAHRMHFVNHRLEWEHMNGHWDYNNGRREPAVCMEGMEDVSDEDANFDPPARPILPNLPNSNLPNSNTLLMDGVPVRFNNEVSVHMLLNGLQEPRRSTVMKAWCLTRFPLN